MSYQKCRIHCNFSFCLVECAGIRKVLYFIFLIMYPWIRIVAPWTWKLEINWVFVYNLANIKLTLFSTIFSFNSLSLIDEKISKRRHKKCLVKLGLKIYRLLGGRVKSVCTLTISSTHLTLLHNTCFFSTKYWVH